MRDLPMHTHIVGHSLDRNDGGHDRRQIKDPSNKRGGDAEKNRFSARAARYARVGANVGGVAARYAGRRLLGGEPIAPATRARCRRRSAGSKAR